jgi:23S rRNA pseudouridine1911/1915/1917 synthase
LIANGHVTVRGRREKASYRLRSGDEVDVTQPPPRGRDVVAESIPLRVAYEDDWLLVVDKPAGMVVHPAPGHWSGTLVNALLGREPRAAGQASAAESGHPDRAGLVHRLDKDTSGLILVAKTGEVLRRLSAALAQRRIRRLYAVLSWGHLSRDTLSVADPIGRDPRDRKRMAIVTNGRSARTDFVRLARFDSADLLRARLFTGRTHQIRVHLASVGHPVVGAETYGGRVKRRPIALPPHRHFLHAAWLTLEHPVTGQMLDLRSPLPPDLSVALAAVAGVAPGIWPGLAGDEALEGDALDHVGFYQPDR